MPMRMPAAVRSSSLAAAELGGVEAEEKCGQRKEAASIFRQVAFDLIAVVMRRMLALVRVGGNRIYRVHPS
jgi:hypothetical protein